MPTRAFMRSILLFVLTVAPAILRAQFQDPTPEELKMTEDPKAPGAAAVYLNFEETTDDPLHYHSVYARIKILSEKAKDLATVDLPYVRGNTQITDIKARTIHSDGAVIPLVGKPEDLLIANSGDRQVDRKVFNLPSVEVGSILEYRYQVRYDDNHYSSPSWEIQHQYFVHRARYVFTPFKAFAPGAQVASRTQLIDEHGNAVNSLIWFERLPPGTQVQTEAPGRFTLSLTDIPPVPQEQWMPPRDSFLYSVNFYYKSAMSSADFWVSEAKLWSKEVDHFAEPTKPLSDAVAGLVRPGDSDLDKAKKIYQAVEALDNTDFSRKRGEAEIKQLGLRTAKRAEDTWAEKSGSRQDITLLYIAMARAAGLTAYDMKVRNRDRGNFEPSYLFFGQLDDDIVILSINGKEIVLDPGEKMCPFQTVHWKHSGASGIRQSADGRGLAVSPYQVYTANILTRTGELSLAADGSVSGSFRFVMSGQQAILWRQAALENDPEEVKKRFDRWLQSIVPAGVRAHVDHFLAIDDPEVNLIAVVQADGALGTVTSKRVLLPGFFFETRGNQPFVDQEKRIEPVDMHYADQVTDQMTIDLPAGLSVEGAPESAKVPWASRAVLATKTIVNPHQVIIARQLSRGFTIVKPEEYRDLRDFYQKVAATDQQQLVLTTASPSGKGN
jgi:hypothetical protein